MLNVQSRRIYLSFKLEWIAYEYLWFQYSNIWIVVEEYRADWIALNNENGDRREYANNVFDLGHDYSIWKMENKKKTNPIFHYWSSIWRHSYSY